METYKSKMETYKSKMQLTIKRLQPGLRKMDPILDFIESFFQQSGIHGLLYLVKHGLLLIEKCLWLVLLIISMVFCVKIGLESVDRYNTKSTVVGLERDFYYWNTTMPGVTVCPLKRLDLPLFDAYCRDHNIEGQQKEEFFEFLESLANSTYMNFGNISYYESIDLTLDQLNVKPKNYIELIYNLTLDNTFKRKDELMNISDKIRGMAGKTLMHSRQVLTEYGLCYMTNTLLLKQYSARYLIFGEYAETMFEDLELISVMRGSYFEMDMVYEYNFLGFVDIPIDAFIHSAFEIMKVDHNYGFTYDSSYHEMECMEIIADEGLEESTTVSQRNCRFQHESNLTHYPIYTKNICLQECRLNLVYKICKCIPHFYPNRIAVPKEVCNYKTLRECLPQHENVFLKLYEEDSHPNETIECNCLQNCQDAIVNKIVEHNMPFSNVLMGGNSIIVTMTNSPTSRLKRQIIFSFTDLLVSIGGTAGLFLGFSVLGFVELLYYFSLRLLWHLRGYKII